MMHPKITAVFLPGKLCDGRLWAASMAELADIVNPIFVDLDTQNTLEEMLQTVSDCCPGKFVLIGFSMGGYIAQEFAIQSPEKLLGLALVGISAEAYSDEEKAYQMQIISHVRKSRFNGLSEAALRKFIHPSNYNNKYITNLIKDMARKSGTNTFLSQHMATINRRSRLDELPKISCPILVIGSRDDKAVPIEDVKKMVSRIPRTEFHVLEECGHMIPLEQPDVLNHLLRNWLLAIREP